MVHLVERGVDFQLAGDLLQLVLGIIQQLVVVAYSFIQFLNFLVVCDLVLLALCFARVVLLLLHHDVVGVRVAFAFIHSLA